MTQSASVHVSSLDPAVTEHNLWDHFSKIGPVLSVRVCVDAQTQKSLGYGYVNFQIAGDAEKALDETGAKILGRHISVAKIQRDPTQRRSGVSNIVVKNLPRSFSIVDLKALCQKYGRITSLRLATNDVGESRGYAYVAFEREESATQAVAELNELEEIEGCKISAVRYQAQYREEAAKQFTNLYVKNLKADITDAEFNDFFGKLGKITSGKCNARDGNAYGFVAYETHEAAAAAVELDDKPSPIAKEGQNLVVRRFMPSTERRRMRDRQRRERQQQYNKYPNLYVKNFDDNVSGDDLKGIFEGVGPTVSVRVMVDPATKQSRCFGFVSMRNQADASRAIQELNGSTFLGPKPLFVTFALKKDARRQALDDMYKKGQLRGGPSGPLAGGPGGPMLGGMGGPGGMMGGMGNAAAVMQQMMYPGMMAQPALAAVTQGLFSAPNLPLMRPGAMMGGMGGMPAGMQRPGGPMMGGPGGQMMGQHMMQQQMLARPGVVPPGAGGMVPPQRVAPAKLPAAPMMMPPQQPAAPQKSLATLLASMSPDQQKNVLGERLYNYILRKNPNEAAKVTGMLLEMDNSEILNLLDTTELLDSKIAEALDVLHRHGGM